MGNLDSELLALAQMADTAAFQKLIIKYEKLIYNIAYRFFNDREDAMDISQEVMIKIYTNLHKCTEPDGIKNWICRITTNTCIDESRKRKGKQTSSIDSYYTRVDNESTEATLETASDELTPEECLLNKENYDELKRAIERLPDDHKILIILRDINGLSYEDISTSQELNIGTVKSRLNRARNNLKKLLLEQKRD